MIYILSGTNRPGSRTLTVSKIIQKFYAELGVAVEIMDLTQIPMEGLDGKQYYDNQPAPLKGAIDKLTQAEGIVVVCPEYNGSMPGILKYFIDHWKYPETFEFRPVCFVGLGGRFGGLRPVEHLQQVFGYRNAFVFPIRVFIHNVWTNLVGDEIKDAVALDLLKQQAVGFRKFVAGLEQQGLDANSFNAARPKKEPKP